MAQPRSAMAAAKPRTPESDRRAARPPPRRAGATRVDAVAGLAADSVGVKIRADGWNANEPCIKNIFAGHRCH